MRMKIPLDLCNSLLVSMDTTNVNRKNDRVRKKRKHYSALGDGGGIILQASKVEHLKSNMNQINRGPLPGLVRRAVEDM